MRSLSVDEVAYRVRQFYEASSFPENAGRGVYMQPWIGSCPGSARVRGLIILTGRRT